MQVLVTAPSGPTGPEPGQHALELSWIAVALSSAVLGICGVMSLQLNLGLHKQLLVAALRMVLQLTALGYLLVPIFRTQHFYVVVLFLLFMMAVATMEAVQRPNSAYPGMLPNSLCIMACSSGTMLTYTILVVLRLRPWYEPQYVIPIFGMLLGNTTSAVSVGLTTTLDDLQQNRAVIEGLLALGATRFEATAATVRRALRTSLLPLLNQMSVMGLVSIPGMMTGQILGGTEPAQAARYQMVILFLIAGSTSLASCASIYAAVLAVVDEQHAFRPERLRKKATLQQHAKYAWAQVRRSLKRLRDVRSGRWGGGRGGAGGAVGGGAEHGTVGGAGAYRRLPYTPPQQHAPRTSGSYASPRWPPAGVWGGSGGAGSVAGGSAALGGAESPRSLTSGDVFSDAQGDAGDTTPAFASQGEREALLWGQGQPPPGEVQLRRPLL